MPRQVRLNGPMKHPSSDRLIQERIESFLTEMSQLVRACALEAVVGVLGDARPVPAPRAARTAPAAKRSVPAAKRGAKRGKRSSAEVGALSETLLEYISGSPGQRLEEIGATLSMPTKEFKLPIQKLLKAKMIHTAGQRRGTKYYPGEKPAKKEAKAKPKAQAKQRKSRRRAKKA